MNIQRTFAGAIVLLFGLSATSSLNATTFHVRKDGSGDFTSIQACVNAMSSGDVCIVGSGTYDERIQFPSGKSGSAAVLTTLKAEKTGAVEIRGVDTLRCNYLRIEGFSISVPGAATWTDAAGIAVRSSNVEIVNNLFHNIPGFAIAGNGNSVTIQSNHIFKCGNGISVSGSNWLVERNDIERLQTAGSSSESVRFSGANLLFRGNHLFGTLSNEIGSAHVIGFQSSGNSGTAQQVIIENNVVEGFYYNGVKLDAAGLSSSDISIRNNLFVAPQTSAVTILGIQNAKLFNNSVINPATAGIRIGATSTAEVKNNIFYSDKPGNPDSAIAELTYSADATSSVVAEKNLLYLSGKTINQAAFPNDIVNKDPLFVSFVSKNYRIRQGSPAINAAATLSDFNYDLNGTLRPQGPAWDIGAYEYPANGVRPAPPGNLRLTAQ